MKLSTRSTYGIRALVELAFAEGQKPLSASSIAARQDLSVAYLEQLLHKLKKGGLVRSVRGPHGGYVLSRSADQITMADAVRLLEEKPFAAAGKRVSVSDDDSEGSDTKRRAQLVSHAVWRCVHERLLDALTRITLLDVREDVLNTTTEPLDHRYVFHI